ncbi:methylated-DNA--[protein]-cysteine S-methyltransferase [Simkania sp.]|uniref:methylated-DNA--[protein]-cysteine S-methyltransferase n=1 Tax=Simkania sp. TaxID=34094 RepID=UPI003B51BCF0
MIEQDDSTNLLLDASIEASNPSFGVSFYLNEGNISHIALFESPTFSCNIYGKSPLKTQILDWIQAYLKKQEPPPLPLDLSNLSTFTRKGLRAIQKISFGSTASYQDVARSVGDSNAARAIGNVCNRNPFPLVIPCHRVISANKTIGGFAYSLELKMNLLQFEQT